jgi:phosphohistidine phosphatase SixA
MRHRSLPSDRYGPDVAGPSRLGGPGSTRRPTPLGATLLALALVLACGRPPGHPVIHLSPDAPLDRPGMGATDTPSAPGILQQTMDGTRGPIRIVLAPGRYRLAPSPYTDPTCGNCTDPAETVPATVGLRVRGAGILIEGVHRDSVVIETHAGYGILFDGCADCVLRGVTVTAGARDPDGRATSGGVVVRHSRVVVEDCRIADNVGDSATVGAVVVGIAGVVGREGSDIRLRGCHLERNSWDGVALYRGARAVITDNVIDGVDRASGAVVGGGRGVGIGLTWDAHAVVERNLVRRYWKGIGAFLDADAEIRHNVVEDVLTWGLAYWGPEGSRPSAVMEENAVYITGACGASIERVPEDGPPPGRLVGNAFARTGQDPRYDSGEPYCPQRPIARTAVPAGFEIADNAVHDSRQPGDGPMEPELDRDGFRATIRPLLERLRDQPATAGSRFVREMGAPVPDIVSYAGWSAHTVDGVARAAGPAAGGMEPGEGAAGVIILVRHAEAARTTGEDPDLTDAGRERALRLAAYLSDTGIEAIHTTDTRRTRSTAGPIAEALALTPQLYDSADLPALAERLARAGGRHLVVGHSNTTPELVRLLGGDPGAGIRDDEFERVYIVPLATGRERAAPTIALRY